ncbi:hypothetical protein ACBJ59_11685 [Nonomuraea sp. MTCD27]|uniref:hypothetical protein n=1 Tax=Nonomuraea sp. MTCD27 TaxID=1676747 RepID=UPI0035C037F0
MQSLTRVERSGLLGPHGTLWFAGPRLFRRPILRTLTVVGAPVSVIPLIVRSGAPQRFWRA